MHYLLTPGPLTTAAATRQAMARDWGSRDRDFIALTARLRTRLANLAGAAETHASVLLQGSGTFVVEAMIATLVPRDGGLLVMVNGAYGRRMVEIAHRLGRKVTTLECAEDEPVDAEALDRRLLDDPATHVAIVHCETTSGILNPLEPVAEIVARHGRRLLVDAMSSFGALPLDAHALQVAALAASSNKCLEGVPGIGFVVADRQALLAAAGNAESLSFDLHAQWRGFETDGQWRFTPPTQVAAALDAALDGLDREGGLGARGARYAENCRVLVAGMRRLGFVPYLRPAYQAPIIVTFHRPKRLDFGAFYDEMHRRGFSLYPGKVAGADTFRIGCIGAIDATVMNAAVAAVADTLATFGLKPAEFAT
jgi:2-aminoethylphosphonate-pyruvate transaminase